MIRLHTTMASVNGYKVRILLSILGLEWEHLEVDMYAMEHKKEPFLSLNPFGQMPAMTDGDYTIADSHACLSYLALKYGGGDWLPSDAGGQAKVAEWMSKSANEVHNGPWIARAKVRRPDAITLSDEEIHARCDHILGLMEAQLGAGDWLACGHPTIADISCFAPISFLPDSGYATDRWANVTAWLDRVRRLPGAIDADGAAFA